MSADKLETELINKITELQQEAKEHQLVLDAFKTVEPERRCFRLVGGVLVERTVKDIKPSLEENLSNIEKAISNLDETIRKRRESRVNNSGSESAVPSKESNAPISVTSTNGVLA